MRIILENKENKMINQATINAWRKNLLRPLKWEVELERVGYTEKQEQK